MGRSPCCSKEGLNQGAWTALEDQKLSDYIKTHGEGKWRTIAKGTGLRRSGKSCRLRWLNYLRPDIKRGNITLEEEDLIIRLHKLLGNRWSLIAGRLPGRTDNEIKNYWNTVLGKKVKGEQSKHSNSNIVKKTETHLSAETPAGSTVVESRVIKPEASKCNKVLGAPQPLEAETPSTIVAPATCTDKNLLNDVLLSSKEDDSGNFAMDFDLGELLMSDMSESDFWRLYEFDYGIPERGKSRGERDLWLSEEILDEWIRDGCFHYNTSLASVAEPQPH